MLTTFKHSKAFIFLFLFFSISLNAQELNLKFDHLTVDNGLPQNSVYSIVKDKYGFMWFGTWGGAVRYDGYSLKVFRAIENDTTGISDNRINAIVSDSLQNIWVQTGDYKYYKYNYEYENFNRFQKVPGQVKKLFSRYRISTDVQVQNHLYRWISNHHVLHQYNLKTGISVKYLADAGNPFSLSDNIINVMYLDNSEALWIGTQNGGINRANLFIKPFSYYHSDKNKDGLIDNVVRAVCKDPEGRIWVGSENQGITVIDRDKNKYSYFCDKEEHTQRIRSVFCDKQGQIWIGTKGGLIHYNPKSKSFTNCSSGICNPNVFALFEDHAGNFWVGTFNGLAKYDRISHKYECLGSSVTRGRQIRAIMEDHLLNLWIATEDGGITNLERTLSGNPANRFKPVHYVHQEDDENSLINNRTYSLAEDNMGMIWIATNSGLSRLDPKNNTFKHFTIKNGLPDDITLGVLFDGKESVWVSHEKGLTRINTKTFQLQSFNVYDGLQGNEFCQNACYRDNLSGEMFFGGTNGLNSFFPDSIKINSYKPKVVFTNLYIMNQAAQPGVKINNRIVLEKSLLCTKEITLLWTEKAFSLEFAALSFANPPGNKYKYKLAGYDKQWTYTDAVMRTARYSNLPPGTYEFKVYASNSDGVWCDKPASIRVIMLPPWWYTWWAFAAYTFAACILVWFIYKYIAGRIEIRKNEEIHQAKLKFFTEVSHEFRTPLTLIIDPLEKLISDDVEKGTIKQYYRLMHRNASHLLLLINQLLDFRKLEAGHLTLTMQHSDFIPFVRSIAASFEARARERNIDFSVQTSVNNLNASFDSAKLHMVLNNLLSNAFKFTPDHGQIKLNIDVDSSENGHVIINISDTGIGIPVEDQDKIFDIFYQSSHSKSIQQGSGIGLALTKEIVELHGGTIQVESEVNKGSCFSVSLPIIQRGENKIPEGSSGEVGYEEENSSNKSSSDHSQTSSDQPLLLLVDDNADIREYIQLNFNKNYRIVMAVEGAEGFRQAAEIIPDIIISDIMMPGMDGLELCRLLKKDERTSHIPVILLTARQSDEAKREGYETGADAYVTKPFNTDVLEAQVRSLLEQRQRLRELFSKGSVLELKKIAINITDEAFLNKVTRLVEESLGDENFDIDALTVKLKMSRSQLFKKIKALTNKSLQDFVSAIRMNKALEYMLSGEYNISEVAYKVGYSLPTNFTRTFLKHFGTSPKKYISTLKNQDKNSVS